MCLKSDLFQFKEKTNVILLVNLMLKRKLISGDKKI